MRKLLIIVFFLLLTSSLSFALDCPGSSFEVNYVSPVSGNQVIFCQKKQDGQFVNHGPYKEKKNGKIIIEKYYEDGKEVAKSLFDAPKSSTKQNYNYSEVKSIFANLLGLFYSNKSNMMKTREAIRTRYCSNRMWLINLFLKKKVKVKFKFAEGCDLQGKMKITLDGSKSTMSFRIKNLSNFNHVALSLSFKLINENDKKKIEISNVKGTLTGTKGRVEFKGFYAFTADPFSGTHVVDQDLGGELTITHFFGKDINESMKIKIF